MMDKDLEIGVRVKRRFVAGETAPSAEDAFSGKSVVNKLGNLAFTGFEKDPSNTSSVVNLDPRTIPPYLYLHEAVTQCVTGNLDPETNEFKHDGVYSATVRVSGIYFGPGSELDTY